MVRAGSLKYGSGSPQVRRLLIGLSVLLVIAILFVAGGKIFSNDSSNETVNKATTTSVPDELSNRINAIGFKVFQPSAILTNFFRTNVDIVTEARTKSDCKVVLQNFRGSEVANEAFIDIYSYSPDCPYPLPGDEKPYSVGNYMGWISAPTSGDGELLDSILIELVVDGSFVRIETDLPIKTIEETIRTFPPYNPVPPKDSLTITI